MGASNRALLFWPGSAGPGRKALRKSLCYFHGPGEQQAPTKSVSACPMKAAKMEWFLLGDVAAGKGRVWLLGPQHFWGAAWACSSSACQIRQCAPGQTAVQAAITKKALK